jgi:uncharacterized membrane protein
MAPPKVWLADFPATIVPKEKTIEKHMDINIVGKLMVSARRRSKLPFPIVLLISCIWLHRAATAIIAGKYAFDTMALTPFF